MSKRNRRTRPPPVARPDPRTLAPPVQLPNARPSAASMGLGSRPGGLGYHGPAYLPVPAPLPPCAICGRPADHEHTVVLQLGGRSPGLYLDGELVTPSNQRRGRHSPRGR